MSFNIGIKIKPFCGAYELEFFHEDATYSTTVTTKHVQDYINSIDNEEKFKHLEEKYPATLIVFQKLDTLKCHHHTMTPLVMYFTGNDKVAESIGYNVADRIFASSLLDHLINVSAKGLTDMSSWLSEKVPMASECDVCAAKNCPVRME